MSERLRALLHRRALVGVAAILALASLTVASMRIATRGVRRALGASVVLAATALILVAGGSAAQGPEADAEEFITPQWQPYALRDGKTTVVVQLAGDPVAAVQGDADHKLSKAEKNAIRAQLKAGQRDVRAQIEKLGGTIVADYQTAYNGLKVHIDRNKTDALSGIANVLGVRALERMTVDNEKGVALIGAPAVWGGLAGLHGEGVKVAIIDTGLDYTHENFGGPGTVAAYTAANAADTVAPAPGSFGPRFKGGIDLVGDDYNADPDSATYQPIPHPDPNPLDCNGHGSHVAGTAAGSGVLANGTEYTGPYNAATISGNSWRIGPGVAPKADLYGIRVFGCVGSTDVTVDAIEWAVENDMDVINMSLGSPFGSNDDPSAVASTNAAKAGVIVVTSAGNSGPNQYITGSPGTGDGSIATAANDASPGFPGATLTTTPAIANPNGSPFTVINANGATIPVPTTGPIVVLQDNPNTTTDQTVGNFTYIGSNDESQGCSPASYTFNGVAPGLHQIAVARRGTCARVAKAIFAQQAGAAVAVMTNNAAGLPPFEGQITQNPDPGGEAFTVTIPFLGVAGNQATAGTPSFKLRAEGNGKTGDVVAALIPNPNFKGFASFSSGGPRNFDSHLKPDVTAPGVSVISTGNGTGNNFAIISGTSMASPHNAGAAALVRQAHPDWRVDDIKSAIVNTADPEGVTGYKTSRAGTGLIQPAGATKTQAVANANGDGSRFEVALNFGFEELKQNFSRSKGIKIENHGDSPLTFSVSQTNPNGSPHNISLSDTSVTVPAGGDAQVLVRLEVPAATAGAANGAGLSFQEVAGLITFTPTAGQNSDVKLRVPYYLVQRPLSDVDGQLAKFKNGQASGTAMLTNRNGVIDGDADFYAWGLEDKKDKGKVSNDLRAVGVQSFANATATNPHRKFMVFAVNTHDPWSTPSANEFDIYVDVNNDGHDDYIVIGVDDGLVRTGTSSGVLGTFVASTVPTDSGLSVVGTTSASSPTNGSTALLFLLSTQLCRGDNPDTVAVEPGTQPCLSNAVQPRLTYRAVSFDRFSDAVDVADGPAKYNPYNPAISQGMFETLAPGGSVSVPISINAAEWALTPALGSMFVTLDNKGGKEEATLLEVKPK